MSYRLTPIWMTLDDLEQYSISLNFQRIFRDFEDFGRKNSDNVVSTSNWSNGMLSCRAGLSATPGLSW